MRSNPPVIQQMQNLIKEWEAAGDDKALFLRCYIMMTSNVLEAVDQQEFHDSPWVVGLLEHFADYYFEALEAYVQDPVGAPRVWQLAHKATGDPGISAVQKLLLGVNAHINYDLVLTLVDLLRSEWGHHSEQKRANRYSDHCHINQIIGRTIDDVQDQVIEPAMPGMQVLDVLLGPVDEYLISGLIRRWREIVWSNATRLLALDDPGQQTLLMDEIEAEALKTGQIICPGSHD